MGKPMVCVLACPADIEPVELPHTELSSLYNYCGNGNTARTLILTPPKPIMYMPAGSMSGRPYVLDRHVDND